MIAAGLLARAAGAAADGAVLASFAAVLLILSGGIEMPPLGWMTALLFGAYYVYFLAAHGTTIGGALTGTVVLGRDGSRLGWLGAGGRAAALLGPVLLSMVVLHFEASDFVSEAVAAALGAFFAAGAIGVALPAHSALHDAASGTRVFYRIEIERVDLGRVQRSCLGVLAAALVAAGLILGGMFVVHLTRMNVHWF
jgi:uncharacterized RDD family membrane protein YckC